MGQYLQTSGASLSKNTEARKLVTSLRSRITLEKLCGVFNDYMLEIYPREDLTWEEFDSLFAPLLNNCLPLYSVLSERQIINIYEVFITLIIFVTGAEFEEKILTIFKAFDVDGGGSLDRKELSKFLMCAIMGLCKMLNLQQPSRLGITQFTFAQFKIIDEDGSGDVEYSEFEDWILTSTEIQYFLLTYTGVQT